MAAALRTEGLPAVVAADRRRSALRRRGLAQAAVLAVRRLHDDRQVRALFRDDRQSDLVLPRPVHTLTRKRKEGAAAPSLSITPRSGRALARPLLRGLAR